MKILILNFRDVQHPDAGGSERSGHILAKDLVSRGHTVTFFCSAFVGCLSEEMIDGVTYVRRGNLYTVYVWALWLYHTRFRSSVDVILEDINGIPWFTVLYSRKPKAILLHHIHQKVFFHQLPWYVAVFALFAERSLVLFYRSVPILTVSPAVKRELVSFGLPEKHITLVYNGIDTGFAPLTHSDEPLLVSVGRVRAYKRLDLLVDAFVLVLEKIPSAKLIIIGAGDALENIKRLVKEKQLAGSVLFTGYVSDAKKQEILGKAWVYCITSSEEGWGIGVIEANASGCPAVAFSVGGLLDSIQDGSTGYLVPFGDVTQFAQKTIQLLEHKRLRTSMGKKALAWSSHFTWKQWTDVIERVLEDAYDKKV